ncbi:chorismate-binding protein, partial [Alphaproteobacteria bacterium]|nr:chorismate-binding protein [Alphaproteobacteria bacterium]
FATVYDEAQQLLESKINQLKESLVQIPTSKIRSNLNFKSNYSKDEYFSIISKAKKYISDGDIFQVVTSQRFETNYDLEAITLYRSLRRLNPSPYLVNLNFNEIGLVASSPELLVQLRNNKITIRPIAGTRKRGKNTSEDINLSKDLLEDEKELAEHLMLLDLGRNDVGRVAKDKSVKVTEKMIIEYYSHVMHIVSNVEGRINNKYNAVDALIAGFPAGTVSGAPKIRAMEIIEELENLNRSFYAGCMGYFDSNGDMDTCISLRSGLVKNGKLYIQAGGGLVYDSKPEDEYQETLNKAGALMAAAEDSYKYNNDTSNR